MNQHTRRRLVTLIVAASAAVPTAASAGTPRQDLVSPDARDAARQDLRAPDTIDAARAAVAPAALAVAATATRPSHGGDPFSAVEIAFAGIVVVGGAAVATRSRRRVAA